ncbi:MAG TPA: TIGR03089 family protein, partial [Pilimelia sp.]|nr:TIGR03089 family protein [Pilimelia sp.]
GPAGPAGPAVGTGAADRFALGFAPLGGPLRAVPAGYADYIVEVRGHGDRFTPYQPVGPGDAARHGAAAADHGGLHAAAVARAADLGLTSGSRVLVDAATHPDPLDWLLAPLVAGATVVLCAGLDAAGVPRRMAAERVTVNLTATPG